MTQTTTPIDPEVLYWFTNSSGLVNILLPGGAVLDIAQSGPADTAVALWRTDERIAKELEEITDEELRNDLREYGAWDDEELEDREANLDRLLWLAAWDIAENVWSGDYVQ